MARETQVYNRTFSGSVGAGLGSVFNASGKRYFILEYKNSSKYHRAGESQQIIVDQIEIGRDSRCQVRFDDSYETVSRRHAAIVRDCDGWKLIHLSKTNSTLINGEKVTDEWFLQNGDEIQLSVNGPRLGFIIPQGEKGFTKSIGLSRRLSLFRQQALRPYRTAIWALGIILLMVIAGFTATSLYQHNNLEKQADTIAKQDTVINTQGEQIVAQGALIDSLQTKSVEQLKTITGLKSSIGSIKKAISREAARLKEERRQSEPTEDKVTSVSAERKDDIDKCSPYIFFVRVDKVEVSYGGNTSVVEGYGWVGTGFLLEDGRFVTARHCVEAWLYPSGGEQQYYTSVALSAAAYKGAKITAYMTAFSNDGTTFSFTNNDFIIDREKDVLQSETLENGESLNYTVGYNSVDIAYTRTTKSGGLKYDRTVSRTLKKGETVYVLGYPLGYGAFDVKEQRNLDPSLSESMVSRSGVTDSGYIQLSNRNFESGNSGGPVMVKRGNEYVVVAVVSIAQASLGFVPPICLMK